MNIKKTSLCVALTLASLQALSYEDGFGYVPKTPTLEEHDPSFGYVGFGFSAVEGAFNLSQSTASTAPGSTEVEPNPITLQPIPSQYVGGIGALVFSAHFGFMKSLQNNLFTAGLFGGFNWSSLSQKWNTIAIIPENAYNNEDETVVDRPASTTPVSSALHVPLSVEAGAHLGAWLHSRVMPFVRVGWSLMRGGVNRTGWVDRYRYTYFNGIIAGGGVDFLMTQQSSLSLSCDWVGYGARSIRNFDTTKNVTVKTAGDTGASYSYKTNLRSYVKPSYVRFMLSIKYVLPNNDDFDAL